MDIQERYHLIQLSTGSKESLAFLFRKYNSKVYHYCFQYVRSKEVAQEITMDVFLKVWEKRSVLKTDTPLSGLLFKITKDASISYLRKAARNTVLRKEFVQHYLQSLENPLEDHLLFKEGMEIAKRAIASLPPRCRQVFLLRYEEGFSLKQIAEELNISVSTVKKQLSKGTLIVRSYLESNADLVFVLILGHLF